MSEPFIGEIRMFAGTYAPRNWAFCDGQELSITQNEMLFSLIGTTYGGDGRVTFRLPDLRGRVPLHMGTSSQSGTFYPLGSAGGVENVTLTAGQLPAHSHTAVASPEPGTQPSPENGVWAQAKDQSSYSAVIGLKPMDPSLVQPVGGSQPHGNMMPFLGIHFIICLFGLYPSRN